MAHLSGDKTAAKMGHPSLWLVERVRFARGANTPPFAKNAKDGAPGSWHFVR
ncbi:MAG TPA: hypothetical protein VNY78_02815 [Edaphobacter sp.]|nr:hypothetical protein [Edaphobacter sp.]